MTNLRKQILELRASILKPTSKRTVLEWATEERVIGAPAPVPGKWRPIVQPAVEIMEAVTTPGVRKITVMGPAQMLKTDLLLNIFGYFMSEDPSSVILAQPIDTLTEAFSKDRVDPMIRDTPILNNLIKGRRDRDSNNTIYSKTFTNGANITLVSAASVSDLSSRTAKVVLLDELDRFKNLGVEGDPEKLLAERTNAYSYNSLNVAASTPTNEGSSRIQRRFDLSNKSYFHANCVHCHQYEKLIFDNVKWFNGDASTAVYICGQCSMPWTEHERSVAVRNGMYIAENPHVTDHLGFHCNALASPFQTIAQIVAKFLEVKDDPEQLRTFVNTSLAETWKQKQDVPDWQRLYDRRETYAIGTVPAGALFLTCGVDVQETRLEASIIGFTRDRRTYLINHVVIDGFTNTQAPWDELEKLIQSQFPIENSTNTMMHISLTCVDSGYNSSKIYDFVGRFNPNKVRPIKGSDSLVTHYKIGSAITSNHNGTRSPYSHHLYMVGSSMIKEMIYANLRLNSPVDGADYPQNFCHFPEIESEYFKQLTAEAYVRTKKGFEWQKQRSRNEALDTFVYAWAAAAMFGVFRFKTQDWDILESKLDAPVEHQVQALQPSQQNKPKPPQSNLWKYPGLKR